MRLLIILSLALGVFSCGGLSAQEFATFTVDAMLGDSGLSSIDVNISCESESPVSFDVNIPAGGSKAVTVPAPGGREMICTVISHPLPGRQLRYLGDGGSSITDESQGCRFTGVRGGHHNFCQVQVEDQETSLTVFKHWIGTSARENDVEAYLDCGPAMSSRTRFINVGKPARWSLEVHSETGITCTVTEQESDAWVQDTSDCENLLIAPGAEEECTIVNTKVVKMIEMLNRYGLVLMIAAFMVVGGFAARRAMV